VCVDTLVCNGAKFERNALLHWQPVKLVTHQLGHTGSRLTRREQKTASLRQLRSASGALAGILLQFIIVQSTVDHHANERVRRIKRQ